MKMMENPRFTVAAWMIMLVAYVVALSQTGGEISALFGACGAIGAIGLAQAWSDLINDRKARHKNA